MNQEKKFRIAFVIVCLSLLWSLLRLNIQNSYLEKKTIELEQVKKEMDSIQFVSDSMYAELYPCEIELNRYEIAYQIFLRRNPKAASQYGDIISQETE